jgi:hypothetical protein
MGVDAAIVPNFQNNQPLMALCGVDNGGMAPTLTKIDATGS